MTTFMNILSTIKVNPLLWLVATISVVTGHFWEFVVLFTVILIHELGHAFTAVFFKWRLVKIELLPFGGVAEMDEYGNRPYHEELLVTLAGPIQHVWMIVLTMLCLTNGIGDPFLLKLLLSVNWMILLFNLAPIWPLDGGKLLFLFFSIFFPYKKARKITLLVSGIFLLLFFGIAFILYEIHLNLLMVLSFLLYVHYVEWKHQSYMHMRFLLERFHKNTPVKRKKILKVSPHFRVDHVLSLLYKSYNHEIHVKASPPYICKEKDLLTAYFRHSAISCAIDDLFR